VIPAEKLSRKAISAEVDSLGWRFALGVIRTCVPVGSLAEAVAVAAAVCEPAAEGSLRIDLRDRFVILTLQTPEMVWVTPSDIDLARRITSTVHGMGFETTGESVQILEIAIDVTDAAAVRPFWKAILGYIDESPGADAIVDPLGQRPSIWFQQMDPPRLERNRIHFDVCVPPDQAEHRIRAAIEAGGTLRYDAEAPAFWVLADPEGNEACVTTWQGREAD
jgi:4a-hydroxytetrahydrobiopterin dehydratase